MMLLELLRVDTSLKIIKNPQWPEEILAISALDDLKNNGVIFLKNAKFLQRLLPQLEAACLKKNGLIIEERYYSLLAPEIKQQLESLAWIATTPHLALSLTLISKPYYEAKFKNLNTQVDGRQMGTTDIHPTARISQNVFIGEHVKIGPNVEIMSGSVIHPHVSIGDNTKIFPNVIVYSFVEVGSDCRLHAGVVVGSDGFGYTFYQGEHKKIWHMGGVVIHDDVEIGPNSCVDAGTFSPTVIGPGCRLDNLVQIAHNVKLGKGCVICGQSGIAGSAILDDYVVLGGRAAVGPDSHIGAGTQVAGGALVNEGAVWPAGSKLGGHPARDLKEWMRGLAYLRKVSL
jgi:UDP-3-O-[3-hydroxymyristoyl] glucosamine N-acyltransferase